MKRTRIIFISILIVFALLLLLVLFLALTSESREKSAAIKKSYKEAAETDKKKEFKNIDVEKYLELYKENNVSIVLIGRSGCEFCTIAEPILQGIAYKYNLNINYLSTDGFSEQDKENLLNSNKYFQKEDGMPTPLLLLVKDSKIVDKVEGLISKDEYIDFFDKNKII